MPTPRTLTPYLCCRDAKAAIDFYRAAFGAVETMRIKMPGGKVGHAELMIHGSPIMLADEFPEHGHVSPQTLGGTGVSLALVVDDADAAVARALAAGATILHPVADQFYGHRSGKILDPFGHRWDISHVIEVLTNEQIVARAARFCGEDK